MSADAIRLAAAKVLIYTERLRAAPRDSADRILEYDRLEEAEESFAEAMRVDEFSSATGAARVIISALDEASAASPLDKWTEDDGPVLWWRFPVAEPPYVGTPLDDDWPGYHTHWTPIPVPEEPAA